MADAAPGDIDRPASRSVGQAPIYLREARNLLYVEAETLTGGTAARVLRIYGETEIQVNRTIPPRQRRAVARHVLKHHDDGRCVTATCLAAQGWLKHACSFRLVGTETA